MDLSEEGYPAIAYWEMDVGDLRCAQWNGATWDIDLVENTGEFGPKACLAFGTNNLPAISYFDAETANLKYATFNGVGWGIELVHDGYNAGQGSFLAIHHDGAKGISYYYFEGGVPETHEIRYARGPTNWSHESVAPCQWVSQCTSMAIDPWDRPTISYQSDEGAVSIALRDGVVWETEVIDPGGMGYGNSIKFVDFKPMLAYWDSAQTNLKVASFDGSIWTIETVDSTPGHWASLSVGPGETPAIAYVIDDPGEIRLATLVDTDWEIEVVDDSGTVRWPSLAFGVDGKPMISYVDDVNRDLKLARSN
jgi:hypothetical protein